MCVKKNELDTQLILSIFRQPLYVSDVSRPIINQEVQPYVYNSWYLLFFLVDCLLSCSKPTTTTDSHLKRIISTNCCIHTVVPPDDGLRYSRNVQRLTKYAKNKLFNKLGFLCRTMFCLFKLVFEDASQEHFKTNDSL